MALNYRANLLEMEGLVFRTKNYYVSVYSTIEVGGRWLVAHHVPWRENSILIVIIIIIVFISPSPSPPQLHSTPWISSITPTDKFYCLPLYILLPKI